MILAGAMLSFFSKAVCVVRLPLSAYTQYHLPVRMERRRDKGEGKGGERGMREKGEGRGSGKTHYLNLLICIFTIIS